MEKARKTRVKKEDIGYGYGSTFPTHLRELLDTPEMTQEKLAEALGISRQSVAQWKDGKTMPDIYYLEKIAEYFNVSADWLIGRSNLRSLETNELSISDLGLSEEFINHVLFLKENLSAEHMVLNLLLSNIHFLGAVECSVLNFKAAHYAKIESASNTIDSVEVFHSLRDEALRKSGGKFTVVNSGYLKSIAKFEAQEAFLTAINELCDILEKETQMGSQSNPSAGSENR